MFSQASITIARSPEQVFPYVDEPDKLKLWMADFISSTRSTDQPESPFTMTFKQMGGGDATRETISEILAYQPSRQITYKTVDQSFEVVIDFALIQQGRNTQVTQTVNATPRNAIFKVVMGVLGRLLARASAKQLQRDLDKLKQVVEGG